MAFQSGALADRLDAKEALWKPELKPLIFGDLMGYRGAVSVVLKRRLRLAQSLQVTYVIG